MPKLITIPILGNNDVPRWESHNHAVMEDETTVETFHEFVFDNERYLIETYGILPGDIIIPEEGYRYVQALQLDIAGKNFVESAFDMDTGFAIGWKQIPRDVEDPVEYFASLLEDNYIALELTPEVSYCDGEYQYYVPGKADSSVSKDIAHNMRTEYLMSLWA